MTLMAERPVMSGTKPRSEFEELLDVLDELNVPDGYKAEIIKGSIVMSPWSKGYYTRVMKLVCSRLEPYLPEGTSSSGLPSCSSSRGWSVRTGRTSMRRTSGRTRRTATAWTGKGCPSSPN